MDDTAGNAVDGVDGADLLGVEAETAGELEGEVGVGAVRHHAGVVEEDREDLVVGNGMQGHDHVREEVDAGLPGEDLAESDGFGRDGDVVGTGHGRFGQQGRRCLVVDERMSPPPWGRLGALEGASQLLAQDQAPVALVAFGIECFLQKEQGCHEGDEEDDASHQVRQSEGIALEVLDAAEDVGVLLSRAGKEAAKCGTKHGADTPDERHEGEGLWLE